MTKRLDIVTIVLDGIPFLPIQLSNFNRINTNDVDWHWHIVHGSAANPTEFGNILDESGKPVTDYGQKCAYYFEKIAHELDASGKLPRPQVA